ncbi:hypothetical protein [Nocardioides convexus]|uniref:hypothetical protein n=1 Tax=Nocardioides convexus TaxID=2712224 RepID=UPI002418898F|nr:hypothetical protein [Nocardioides convexus]
MLAPSSSLRQVFPEPAGDDRARGRPAQPAVGVARRRRRLPAVHRRGGRAGGHRRRASPGGRAPCRRPGRARREHAHRHRACASPPWWPSAACWPCSTPPSWRSPCRAS